LHLQPLTGEACHVRYQHSRGILDRPGFVLSHQNRVAGTDRLVGGGNCGRRLTVSSEAGGYLIAFLALYVTFSLNQLWHIVCYVCHFWSSSLDKRHALHYQHQTLLRSGLPAVDYALAMSKIIRAWRKIPGRSGYKACCAMVAFAFAFKVCVIAAGLLSSLVATTDGAVLVNPSHCGWPPQPDDEDDLVGNSALYIPGVRIYENARGYALKCYNPAANPNGASCNTFVKPTLGRTMLNNLDCPFGGGICESQAVRITSDFIDSHLDLGINARPEDRIRFRKTLTCAVLDAENERYNSGWTTRPPDLRNASNPLYNSQDVGFMLFYLGPQIVHGQVAPYSFYFSNVSAPRTGYQTQ